MDDHNAILEDLLARFRTFGDGLEGFRDEMKNFREETNGRLDNLEQKVTYLSIDNRQEHQQLMQMIKEIDREVQVEIKRVK